MSLTVGELTGFISIDDSGVDPALRRAEQAMRQAGQRMGDDTERSGRQAGQNLGDGFVRGADGRLRDLRGNVVTAVNRAGDDATRAARQAGDDAGNALGDGLTTAGGDGADEAVGGMSEKLGKLKVAAAGVGVAAGAILMDAFGQALEQGQITAKLGASMGKTPAEAQKYGRIAGQLYADAVTEDFQGAADTIGAVMAAGLVPPDATNAQIQSISANLHDLSDTFELDLGQAANAVGQIMKTGLAKNAKEAFDVMTRGMQVMGPRADDLADTFNEYSTIFRQMGISAKDATGLLSQGMAAGARDTDVVADSLKEFVLIAQGGGTKVDAAFKTIGLSGKAMQDAFTKGGPEAKKALDQVFDGMRNIKDPTERAQVALALFGTKAEDTQKALFALDPSKAADALGKVGGAADKMGDSIRDNAATQIEAFKRGAMQHLVDFLGVTAIPALMAFRKHVLGTFGNIWADAGKNSGGFADRIISVFATLGQKVGLKIVELAPQAIDGLIGFGQKVADFVVSNPEKVLKIGAIAAAITLAIVALPLLVGAALSMAAALMMLGFGQKLITGINDNLPLWWAAFTGWIALKASQAGTFFAVLGSAIGSWFGSLWNTYVAGPVGRFGVSFITWVRGLPGRAVGALATLGTVLAAVSAAAWRSFSAAAATKGVAFIAWVRGIPGRVISAIGSVKGLLVGKGRNIVEGLWSGIQSMGGWLRSRIMGWAKSVIPGPVAKALGIGSPSKVMAQTVGRWIPAGIAMGAEQNTGVLDKTMANLVNVPTPSASYASAMGSAMSGTAAGGGTAAAPRVVRLDSGGTAFGEFIIGQLRQAVGERGGDVQFVLGK